MFPKSPKKNIKYARAVDKKFGPDVYFLNDFKFLPKFSSKFFLIFRKMEKTNLFGSEERTNHLGSPGGLEKFYFLLLFLLHKNN